MKIIMKIIAIIILVVIAIFAVRWWSWYFDGNSVKYLIYTLFFIAVVWVIQKGLGGGKA